MMQINSSRRNFLIFRHEKAKLVARAIRSQKLPEI